MNKILVIIFIFSLNFFVFSQEKNINFIISVDGTTNSNIGSIKIKALFKNNEEKIYNMNYFPGNLKINDGDYKNLKSNNIKNLSLYFVYNEICNDEIEYYHYEIDDFKINWLESYYFILYVYNTSKKEYKKVFTPLPNKAYTYEYDSPEGSMRRVTKKKRKKICCK